VLLIQLQNISKNFMLQKQADIEAMNATNFEYENDDQNNQTTH